MRALGCIRNAWVTLSVAWKIFPSDHEALFSSLVFFDMVNELRTLGQAGFGECLDVTVRQFRAAQPIQFAIQFQLAVVGMVLRLEVVPGAYVQV